MRGKTNSILEGLSESKDFDEFIEDNNKKVAPLVKLADDPIDESSAYTKFETFKPAARDVQKMEEYKAKGSNPKTLANTVKDKDKAISRYYIAFDMGWEECALAFAKRAVELGYTQDNVEEIANKLENGSQGIDLNKFKKRLEDALEDIGLGKSQSKSTNRKTIQAKVEYDNPFESTTMIDESSITYKVYKVTEKPDYVPRDMEVYTFVGNNKVDKSVESKIESLTISNPLKLRTAVDKEPAFAETLKKFTDIKTVTGKGINDYLEANDYDSIVLLDKKSNDILFIMA